METVHFFLPMERISFTPVLLLAPLVVLLRVSYTFIFTKLFHKRENAKKMAESSYFCLQYLILAVTGATILLKKEVTWRDMRTLHSRRVE